MKPSIENEAPMPLPMIEVGDEVILGPFEVTGLDSYNRPYIKDADGHNCLIHLTRVLTITKASKSEQPWIEHNNENFPPIKLNDSVEYKSIFCDDNATPRTEPARSVDWSIVTRYRVVEHAMESA